MLGVKRTVESVTSELIEGFADGTVVLNNENLPRVSVKALEAELDRTINESKKRLRMVYIVEVLAGLALIAVCVGYALLDSSEGGVFGKLLSTLAGMLVGCIIGGLNVHLRGKANELKDLLRMLKLSDEETAQRLAARMQRRLEKRQLSHH